MVDVTQAESGLSISIVLPQAPPLVVELDGQLLRVDPRQEHFFGIVRRLPGYVWRQPRKLVTEPGAVRAALAKQALGDVETWPVDEVVAGSLEKQAALGRRIVLLTETSAGVSDALVARFPFISQVVRAEGLSQMTEDAKSRVLGEALPGGFSRLPAPSHDAGQPDTVSMPAPATGLRALARCMRLHQWVKNVLIFLPAVLDGKASDPSAWMAAAIGFVALGLVASATYIVNDIWDLADDRRHWSKRRRPIAHGDVPIAQALLWAAALGAIGFGMAFSVSGASVLLIGLYAAVTLGYTVGLKRVPILDVVVLAGLFTLRLGLGMALTDARMSYWLLVFSMFVFTSLSAAKRHTEIRRQIEKGVPENGRGYLPADQPLMLGFGLASMFAALLISVLYLIEDAFPSGFYANPAWLWSIPILMSLFLGRIWLLSQRGELKDDPVEFAVFDKASLALGLSMVLCLILAIAG